VILHHHVYESDSQQASSLDTGFSRRFISHSFSGCEHSSLLGTHSNGQPEYTSLNDSDSRLSAFDMSAGGLSRRRVAASSSQADEDGDAWGFDGGAPQHAPSPSPSSNNISHAGSAFEGGSKIAFDPKDLIDQGEEDARQGGKAPRLTIMEEVLLLGLKDRQVCIYSVLHIKDRLMLMVDSLAFTRDTYRFGTTTFHTHYEAAF
jgi:hypothetical protein